MTDSNIFAFYTEFLGRPIDPSACLQEHIFASTQAFGSAKFRPTFNVVFGSDKALSRPVSIVLTLGSIREPISAVNFKNF